MVLALQTRDGVRPEATQVYSSTIQVAGDIDVRADVALDGWSGGLYSKALIQRPFGSPVIWSLEILTTGIVRFRWRELGGTDKSADSTVAPTVADFERLTIRATLDVDNGASGYDVNFYTSTDNVNWTQLGSTITGAGVTNIDNTRTQDTFFMYDDTTAGDDNTPGLMWKGEVYDGIGGTLVGLMDPNDTVYGDTDGWASSLLGETIAQNNSTVVYGEDTTVTVAASGADYTGLSAALADAGVDAGFYKIRITDTADYNFHGAVIANTGTPDIDRRIIIEADEASRHAGIAGTGHASWTTTSSSASGMDIDSFTQIQYLQLNAENTALRMFEFDSTDVLFSRIIGYSTGSTTSWLIGLNQLVFTGNTNLYIDNSVFVNLDLSIELNLDASGNPSIYLDHCTFALPYERPANWHFRHDFNSKNNLVTVYTVYNCWLDPVSDPAIRVLTTPGTGSSLTVVGSNNVGGLNGFTDATDNTTAYTYAANGVTETTTTTNAIIVTDISPVSTFDGTPKKATGAGVNELLKAGTNRQGSEPDPRQDFSTDIRGFARTATSARVDIGAFQITPDVAFKVWDGAAFVDSSNVAHYDGAAWVDVSAIQYWDGAAWADPA